VKFRIVGSWFRLSIVMLYDVKFWSSSVAFGAVQ